MQLRDHAVEEQEGLLDEEGERAQEPAGAELALDHVLGRGVREQADGQMLLLAAHLFTAAFSMWIYFVCFLARKMFLFGSKSVSLLAR